MVDGCFGGGRGELVELVDDGEFTRQKTCLEISDLQEMPRLATVLPLTVSGHSCLLYKFAPRYSVHVVLDSYVITKGHHTVTIFGTAFSSSKKDFKSVAKKITKV